MALSLFSGIRQLRYREENDEIHEKLCNYSYKTPHFKHFFLGRAEPSEMVALGEFLDQDDFAEDVLQDIYKK
jgi:hypothetical protein